MDRLWKASLLMAIVLGALWWWGYRLLPSLRPPYDLLLFIGAAILFALAGFSFLTRNRCFIQAHPDHLRLVTPLLPIQISYQRLRSVRPSELRLVFPPKAAKGAEKSLLEPYYGQTVVLVELNGYPLHPRVLHFFLPRQMFLPKGTGLVLLVQDWMGLSTDIDTFLGAWRYARSQPSRTGLGIIGNGSKRR